MIIEKIDAHAQPPALAAFVTRHRLFFNTGKWLSNYPASRIRQCMIMNNNREVIGCFTFYLFRKTGFSFIITPPFSPDISLFYVNPAESVVAKNSFVKELMSELGEFFGREDPAYLNLNLPAAVADTQPLIWAGYLSRTRYTYLLDLLLTEDQLWKNLSPEKRKSLGKAGKDGLVAQSCSEADLIYKLVMQSLGRSRKNKNSSIIKSIISAYCGSEEALAYVAYDGDKPVAASFCLIEGKKALYLFGGYDASRAHHGAGPACMWQSILEARRRGLEVFDFEGSMDKNIERYFREFGPQLVPYHCVEKVKPLLKILLKVKGHEPL